MQLKENHSAVLTHSATVELEATERHLVFTTSIEEVQACFEKANTEGIPVQFLGGGFSCHPSFKGNGIVLKHRPEIEASWINDTQVLVSGASTWVELQQFLARSQRSFPVLTAKLDTCIAGTLSVGGYGIRSLKYGCQSSYVAQLQLVLPNGEVLWCSPDTHSTLFFQSLGGMGQVGLIHQVILNTIPEHGPTKQYGFAYNTLTDLVQSLEWITTASQEKPDTFRAFMGKSDIWARKKFEAFWGISANSIQHEEILPTLSKQRYYETTTANIDLDMDQDVNRWVNCFPQHRQLLMDYVLDYPNYLKMAAFVESMLHDVTVKQYLEGIYLLIHKQQDDTISPWASHNQPGQYLFGIGLYFMIPDDQQKGFQKVRRVMQKMLTRCLELKGRPYRYGWHELSESQYLSLYSNAQEELLQLKKRYDPHGILPLIQ